MLEPWALHHRRWKKKFAWTLYQKHDLQSAAALHATASSEAENLLALGLKPPVFVVPNGIQPPPDHYLTFKPNSISDQKVRCAVFLSRIHPKKGLPILAEAWSRVRPVNWKMNIVGPDEEGHLAEVKALTARLGIAAAWEFHSQALGDEKWKRLAEAELMILPTYSENFGNVIPEALLVETPVITTTGAPWQGLEVNRCGWWTAPTLEGIEAALREAIDLSPQTRREMGARGRQWALGEFAWPDLVVQMIDAYSSVV